MLPQDASRILPLFMAVYGSAHITVRTVCAAVCGSVWQCVAVRAAVCGSAHGSARGSVRQCAW
jgi:hypothetical protein